VHAIRTCPEHRIPLQENPAGRLRCPRARHRIAAWIVVDLDSGSVLGGGRSEQYGRRPSAVWPGPELAAAASWLITPTEPCYALPVKPHPRAA